MYGFIDNWGKIAIPFKYDNFCGFCRGLVAVEQNGKWGFIDKLDIIVVPFNYDRIQCSDVFILGEQNYKTFIIANPYYNKVIQLDKVYYLVSSHRIG